MNNILSNFNDKQIEAVTTDLNTPVLVVAGAGSGKTLVLTCRIVHLISQNQFKSNRILGFTFTNKAANEMKERIAKVLPDYKFNFIGTFHSICLRILREDIKALELNNITSNFGVIDEDDQLSIIKEIYKKENISTSDLTHKFCISWISKLKSEGYYDADDLYEKLDFFDGEGGKNKKNQLIKVFKEYTNFLSKSNLLDFDDLLNYAYRVLKIKFIQEKWQNRFDYILVDEFQDTNLIQYEIIKLLVNQNNVFAVGDPDQMIYSWRGAKGNIFSTFQKDFSGTKTIVLERNYRSTKRILGLANSLISKNKNRIEKKLYTNTPFESQIVFFEAEQQNQESKFVCNKIKELVDVKGYEYKDIAILYRANYLSRNIEQYLLNYQIPHIIFGGFSFYQRKEIKDIIAYLKVIANSDEVGLTRIYNMPKRGISELTFSRIKDYATKHNISTFAAFNEVDKIEELSAKNKEVAKNFYNLICEFRDKEYGSIVQLVEDVINKVNYLEMLQDNDEQNRTENIDELKRAIANYELKNNGATLASYLQEVTILTNVNDNEHNKKNKDNSVFLMTVHMAKGLEFKIIFIIQFNETIFPSQKSIEEGFLEEERRIAYVAITRAKEHLFISCSREKDFYSFNSRNNSKTPSRFISEVDTSLLDVKKVYTAKNTRWNDDAPFYNNSKTLDSYLHKEKEDYFIGDMVEHSSYGLGMVTNLSNNEIEIAFKNSKYGVKSFIKHHKTIKKVKQ